MTTTETTVRPGRSPRSSLIWLVPAAIAIAATLFVVNISQSTPNDRTIRVENGTGAHVTLGVAGAGEDAWLGLGTIDPESRATFESVADQGRVWRFRLAVGPTALGEIIRTSEQLRAADWRIVIPADAADRLPPERR